jgi:hypothetical protein
MVSLSLHYPEVQNTHDRRPRSLAETVQIQTNVSVEGLIKHCLCFVRSSSITKMPRKLSANARMIRGIQHPTSKIVSLI